MTPRDLAKFGAFYLNDGCVGEERLLPEGWVTKSTTPSRYYNNMESCCESGAISGYSWWLNTDYEPMGTSREYPDAPEFYYGSGHWGQYLIVIPSWDVVIVRTGDDRDGSYDNNVMIPLRWHWLPTLLKVQTQKRNRQNKVGLSFMMLYE